MKKTKIVAVVLWIVSGLLGAGISVGNTEINIGVNNSVNTGKIVGYDCNKGSGILKKQQRSTGLFEKINIDGSFNVNIVIGQKSALRVTADSNLLSLISTEIKNKTLYIATTGSFCTSNSLLVDITTKKIASIVSRGTSEVVVDAGSFYVDSIFIDLADTSSMMISGKGEKADIILQDASELNASRFEVKEVTINTSGAAEARIMVTGSLSAQSRDASEVHYRGEPGVVKKNVLDAGDILPEGI